MSATEELAAPHRVSLKPDLPGRRRIENGTIRVFCAQTDVIGKIGGGEAAAARLLGLATDALVTWPVTRPLNTELPRNFEHVPIDTAFRDDIRDRLRLLPRRFQRKDCEDFYEAISIAHAVRGREFDIVECPDYLTYGRFLPFALAEYGVKYKRLVCSLHGRLSRTLEIENEFNQVISPAKLDQLRQAELQFVFGAADIRYGFSERYVTQTKSLHTLPVQLVDPLCALPARQQPIVLKAQAQQRAWFVARQDRFKGTDLFLAAVFRAGPELWNNYAMCGPSVRIGNGNSVSEGMSYCRHRGMPFHYRGPLPYADIVREVYQGGGLVVVPSREETFNLVALEALLNGAPVMISKYAGAADFIRKRFGSDFAGAQEFDPFNEFTAAATMKTMLREVEERRHAVQRALTETDLTPQPERLMDAYASEPLFDAALRDEAFRTWDLLLKNIFVQRSESNTLEEAFPQTAEVRGKALFKLADATLDQSPGNNVFVARHQARRLAALSPHTNRARIYRYLAECEETSRPAVAAAYRLRAFRMNALSAAAVSTLADQLNQLVFPEEEKCFRLWSSQDRGSDGQITDYLEERRTRLMSVKIDPPEYIVDHRDAATPKVSIMVSMYNAPAAVVDHFLAQLTAVTMVRNRQAEVVFIDSGSSTPQRELLEANPALRHISYAVVRSVNRETIQTAWNRGLQLSRAEYITCLGVDEGVTESSLDDLSEFLDQHPDVDWVTANTVITQVDELGRWKRDVMSYQRPSYSRFNYFNDCTYINYVGGLYRRSIHARFGWYDGTFKGAGDTEFKCRIFPYIRTAALPKTLGFYFDFPAARVTNSANIEVEDLRAWYVFRTIGGIEYLMRKQDTAAWEELFWTALSGRRCWSNTPADCDLSFAANVLTALLRREPSHRLGELAESLSDVIREMRLLQDWSGRRSWLGSIAELDLIERSRTFFHKCATERPDLIFPPDFRSDAFFFAHNWVW